VLTLAPGSDTTGCNLFGPRCAYRLVMVKLLSHQVCNIFKRSANANFRSRFADRSDKSCERKFLIPASVAASSNQTSPVLDTFADLCRPEHTPSPVRPVVHNPKGGNRSII
jgi:hypothetical protein